MIRSHSFPRSRRLHGRLVFSAVHDAKVRETRGPLTIYALPNELGYPRFGISIGRPVGNAVKRNRIKRRLREQFRAIQHDLTGGYDLLVIVRPHEILPAGDYRAIVIDLANRLHRKWQKMKP